MSKNYWKYEVEVVTPSALKDWLDRPAPGGSIDMAWEPFAVTSDGDFCIRRIAYINPESDKKGKG